ncbi:MAG: flagellar assembly protein FliW [Candidatus Omnitrophica bacterium]|nr:flagellar assembly protein FliW [Candidatus Omnitrophota bacterium]MBU4478425.1 flagellar assembly protein FliW [Candidatus Omnitrophota bacterium]
MKTSVAQIERVSSCKESLIFPEGIIGFAEHKEYAVINEKSKEPFVLMQSEKDSGLNFVVVDPREIMPDYNPSLSEADKLALGVESVEECQCFSIVTIPQDSDKISVNLLAPILINQRRGIGRQVVLQDQNYSLQHQILDEMTKQSEDKDVSSLT